MPLWSRAPSTSHHSSSSSSSALPSTSPPPSLPNFLANHHRSSSSTHSPTSTSLSRTTGKSSNKKQPRTALEADQLGADDEPWDEGSDDEAAVAQLAAKVGRVALSVKPVTGGAEGAGQSSGGGAAASPSSAWFNPFAPARPGASTARRTSASSTLTLTGNTGGGASAAAEAVAAALCGKPPPVAAPASSSLTSSAAVPTPVRQASYLAGASKVQEEADKQVREEERRKSLERGELTPELGSEKEKEGEEGEGEEEKGGKETGTWRKEQWRKQIREDVDDLVRDPAHVLARLQLAWAPPPPPSPTTLRSSRVDSVSSVPSPSPASPTNGTFPSYTTNPDHPSDDEDDDDPAAGYVQLDAPSLSSTDPSLFDYSAPPPDPSEEGELGRENRRKRKFLSVLSEESVDLSELRKLAWNGVPSELRTMVWQLLLGYLPLPSSRRASTLTRKRLEYASLVKQAFSRGVRGLEPQIWHQISIDVPRTRPGVLLWAAEATQRSLERVLYVWAIRHPASGYVQGINDLVCPFFEVFLEGYIAADPESFDVSLLPSSVLEALEADSFWCLSKLLDGIQDNYIFAQPGILRQVKKMESLCARVDAPLAAHLSSQSVEFIQFAFRWMNCLLMRELSVRNIVRMWDTYLAEGGDAFSEFHLYVCLAFLVRWSDKLREMDFQSIIIFLQSLPTQDWTDKDTELLLSEAFLWSRTFQAR